MMYRRIGLALSGGGVRAVAFHAGVLRWLAEKGLLERVEHVSSVSGGSLFTGLVIHHTGSHWPSSTEYVERVYPQVRQLLTTKSLQMNALCRLLVNPLNWRYLLSRANVVSQSIEHYWGISETLDGLPSTPVWSINGTTAESGRRFRFKGTQIGDYEIGYATANNYKIADAMAVSAAFPGGIGPLTLDTALYKWYKRDTWNAPQPPAEIKPKYRRVHLYDGGVYDNLGLEPLFDIGTQLIKDDTGSPTVDCLIVSDAGALFARREIPGPLNLVRLKRVADVAFDQARALRVRSFVNFLKNNTQSGMYLQLGSNPVESLQRFASGRIDNRITWLSEDGVCKAASYETTLSRMAEEDFDLIAQHGYETAMWNALAFLSED